MAKIDKHAKSSSKHPKRASGKDKADDKKKKNGEARQKAKPAIAGTWLADFQAADKDKNGKLAKSELKVLQADRKAYDTDSNGKVDRREYHAGFRKANSFQGLDKNADGALDAAEVGKRRGFSKASFDADADGKVSETEFTQGRRTETLAIREARRDRDFKALTPKQKKALTGYDQNLDGKVSREEFGAGRDRDIVNKVSDKISANYQVAGGKEGTLAAGETYKAYDKDTDGNVTFEEFDAGQRADRAEYWSKVKTQGGVDTMVARRLNLDEHGLGINRLGGPKKNPGTPGVPGNPGTPEGPVKGMTDVVISSFNVLGSTHTAPGGKHPEMASGPARMRGVVDLLKQHKVDIVGFQEFQGNQLKAFQKMAGDKYAVYPGSKLDNRAMQNSIAWDKTKWEMVKPGHVKIPYFNGKRWKMPVVLLKNKETGQKAYFANFHNPADTRRFHNQERFRDEAARIQVDLANRLRKTGLPLFFTGDMNERNEYHQHLTRGSKGMHASSERRGRLPKNTGIDWIFGSPQVTFTRHVRDTSAKVRRTSDHPMIVARAKIRNGR